MDFETLRNNMVTDQIEKRNVHHHLVLDTLRKIPRHLFVPAEYTDLAYADLPLPLYYSQTISQPYIVAYMTAMLQPQKHHRILEIGTGSGYQTAILAELVDSVVSVEVVPELHEQAKNRLAEMGYTNITFLLSDGYQGCAQYAPYDGIIVTAAPVEIPPMLVEQLGLNGHMVIPVGDYVQDLLVISKDDQGHVSQETCFPVRFVPMLGK